MKTRARRAAILAGFALATACAGVVPATVAQSADARATVAQSVDPSAEAAPRGPTGRLERSSTSPCVWPAGRYRST
jgi:hypothetical protein